MSGGTCGWRIRDDGKGIDPTVLNAGGREGHYGLAGMQELAKLVGAGSQYGANSPPGTEIELVPATFAYTPISNKVKEQALPLWRAWRQHP
jgi:nitrate/nitrite-specific signal transduction histidine kinase